MGGCCRERLDLSDLAALALAEPDGLAIFGQMQEAASLRLAEVPQNDIREFLSIPHQLLFTHHSIRQEHREGVATLNEQSVHALPPSGCSVLLIIACNL